ncbi:hypothetical protein [Acidianus manzaensis]|uniref:Uncharacterized protein n=1 Tax=Acidianus manzaensis TaxID=282676 RepID=A0A1W6K2Z0_9CREN|nr:hypothetical protein [Acidianus manzaensis]ARM76855.1 hypothetical protein B6F84_13050 [Acidianus manzaensis]
MRLLNGLSIEYIINLKFNASFLDREYSGKVRYYILDMDENKIKYKVDTDEELLIAKQSFKTDLEKILLMKIEPGEYEHNLSQNFGSGFPILSKKNINIIKNNQNIKLNPSTMFPNFPLTITNFDTTFVDVICQAGKIRSYKFSITGKKDFVNLSVDMYFDVESGILSRLNEKGKMMLIKLNIENELYRITPS